MIGPSWCECPTWAVVCSLSLFLTHTRAYARLTLPPVAPREVSANALASCIATFGGLIPNNVRGTLDSITQACLSNLYGSGDRAPSASVFAYSHVKCSMLQLGLNCTCVPWGDGGTSTITGIVRRVTSVLRHDADLSVSSIALSSLCALDAMSTPRSLPLLVPARADGPAHNDSSAVVTASSLMQQMNQAKIEEKKIAASEKVAKEKAKSVNKKSKKRAKKEVEAAESIDNRESAPTGLVALEESNTTTTKPPVAAVNECGEGGTAPTNDNIPAGSNSDTILTQRSGSNGTITAKAKPSDDGVDLHNGNDEAEEKLSSKSIPDSAVATNEKSGEGVKAIPDVDMKERESDMEEDENDDDDSSGSSLGDFPDIIDGDPDEEDR